MSEYDSEFGEPAPENEPEEIDLGGEIDPAVVAFLDQEEAAFAQERDKFVAMYGFDHDCHCAADYSSGKVVTVTECFMELSSDALDRAAEATYEARALAAMLQEMLDLNKDLVKMIESLGGKDDLEAYFKRQMELQDEAATEEPESEVEGSEPEQQLEMEIELNGEPEIIDDGDDS